jgi:hypothetical protein
MDLKFIKSSTEAAYLSDWRLIPVDECGGSSC